MIKTLLVLLILAQPAMAIDKLKIHNRRDSILLPYTFTQIKHTNTLDRKVQYRTAKVFKSSTINTYKAFYVYGRNTEITKNDPAVFSYISYPPVIVDNDNAEYMVCNDWEVYYSSMLQKQMVIAVGYRNNSAFAVKLDPVGHMKEKMCFAIGEDGNDDGKWEPEIFICLLNDYDYDGLTEVFIYINTKYEDSPRELFCLELESFEIEWSIPVASTIPCDDGMYSVGDSLSPAIIFTSNNPFQGFRDANFSDSYKYISIVNNRGELEYNRIISNGIDCSRIKPGAEAGVFYLLHTLDLINPDSISLYLSENIKYPEQTELYIISRIDSQARILDSIHVDAMPKDLWLGYYKDFTEKCVYVKYADGVVRVYNKNLKLLAESASTLLEGYLGEISIPGVENALAFQDGIYTYDLKKKLLNFPFYPAYMKPLLYDSDSNAHTLVLSTTNRYSIGEISKKGMLDLLLILYVKYRAYLLMAFSGLLVGLFLVNYYRHKTKNNLKIMSEQKHELEETHKALKDAQAIIISQEKYKQAQDIAGGFAHEIRNALFPAKSALIKINRINSDNSESSSNTLKLSKFTDQSLERAIKLTDLISQYTKLEISSTPTNVELLKVVNDSLKMYKYMLEEYGITLKIEGEIKGVVKGNHEQLLIVFNNIILNAIDALLEIEKPQISICEKNVKDCISILISDNGTGIEEENINSIFDVFYSTKPAKGSGLGLAMVKRIIEMYNGSVTAINNKDQGATFILRFVKY